MICEEFDKQHADDYFAISTEYILSKKDHHTDEKRDENARTLFIRLASAGEEGMEILRTDTLNERNRVERFMILPTMSKTQRDAIFSVGAAGTGKTYTVNMYAQMYKMMHPNNRIIFFSMNTHDIDRSLDKSLYQFVNMQKFIDEMEKKNEDMEKLKNLGKEFKNCLLIFDDIGKLKSNKHNEAVVWNFIDGSLEDFRKVGTSVIVIGHTSRTYNRGNILKEEMTHYIIYPQTTQSLNDRILDVVFNFPRSYLKNLFKLRQRWACFDCKKHVLITPEIICPLDTLETI